jgi:hypothetical protein
VKGQDGLKQDVTAEKKALGLSNFIVYGVVREVVIFSHHFTVVIINVNYNYSKTPAYILKSLSLYKEYTCPSTYVHRHRVYPRL